MAFSVAENNAEFDYYCLNADTKPVVQTRGARCLVVDTGQKYVLGGDGIWYLYDAGDTTPGAAATIADGANVVEGSVADATVAAGAAGTLSAKLRRVTQGLEDLKTLIVLGAGTALIGKTGSDRTTPGTTNSVAPITSQDGVAGNTGVVGATTQRVTLATDVALPAGTNKLGTVGIETVASATLANVASSATNVTLRASNAARKGLTIFNDSTQIVYVKMGATAAATSYTVQLNPNAYWELPVGGGIYTGIVDGIWVSANGNARVTEW